MSPRARPSCDALADRPRPRLAAQADGARRIFDAPAADADVRRLAPRRRAPSLETSRPGARSPSGTAPTGATGPSELRDPDSDGVRRLRRPSTPTGRASTRGCSGCSTRQLRAASGDLTVLQDLPIGVDGGGADAWAWQDMLADGRDRRRAARPVQRARPELGVAAVRAVAAARARLRAVHRSRSARRWPAAADADRPRDGAVPALVDPRRRGRRRTAPTCATRATTCSTSSRWRAIAPARSWSARTSARSRTASARRSPNAPMLSYRLLWFEQDEPDALARARDGARSPPTTCRRSPGSGPASDLEDQVAHVPRRRPALERDRAELLAQLRLPPRRTATASRRRGRGAPTAGRGAVRAAVGDPRGRGRRSHRDRTCRARRPGPTGRSRCRSTSTTYRVTR